MSAINPASFVTPPGAGLQGSSGMANPLYSQDGPHADRRNQHEGRAYGGARDPAESGLDGIQNPVGMPRNVFTDSYQPFAQPSRQDPGHSDAFAPYSPTSYGPLETGFSDYAPDNSGSNGAARMHPAQGEWVGRFQGLSLNS